MDMVIQARLISPQRLSALSTWHWHIELHTFINQFYHAEIDELQNASNVCFVASLVDQKPTVNYQTLWATNHIIVCFSEDIQSFARQTCQVAGESGTCMFVWECLKTEGKTRFSQFLNIPKQTFRFLIHLQPGLCLPHKWMKAFWNQALLVHNMYIHSAIQETN